MPRQAFLRRSILMASALAANLPVALPLLAQEIRLGGEFQVSVRTLSTQRMPAVARNAGGFVVAWRHDTTGLGGIGDIFVRRFSSSGAALGGELQANSYTAGHQTDPAVAIDTAGGFVVAWTSYEQDGYERGVFAQRFSSEGTPVAGELQVGVKTATDGMSPAVAAAPNGDFVVVWNDNDMGFNRLYGRRFSSSGAAIGAEIEVASLWEVQHFQPAVAADAAGDFVVAWASIPGGSGPADVYARRFSSAGAPMWTEIQVNVHTEQDQSYPAVAAEPDGDFVVAWDSVLQDGSYDGIFARRFSSAGGPLTPELAVNTYTLGFQRRPALATDQKGGFVVVWRAAGDAGGALGRRFDRSGEAQGPEFLANTSTWFAVEPAVAMSPEGDFVVVWSPFFQDGSFYGVFGQRFGHVIVADIDGNGRVEALTDSLLLLRYAFGFRGSVLVTGAVDLTGCNRCSAEAIEVYLDEITK